MESALERARDALTKLDAATSGAFDSEARGFAWFAAISDPAVRVVRSNQVIELIGTSRSHLDAVADAARAVAELVGPNGRVMPSVDDAEAIAEQDRVWVEITDGLRAAGSLFDVLGGLATLFLGLAHPPTRADYRHLRDCAPLPAEAADTQRRAAESLKSSVSDALHQGPAGWFEWTLESRNAMVHRGRAMATWFPAAAGVPSEKLFVVTEKPPHQLLRYYPRLRRMPDLSDAETVLAGARYQDLYLNESAQETLRGLAERSALLVTAVAKVLLSTLDTLDGFFWPEEQWALQERGNRSARADAFTGFDEDGMPINADAIVMNPQTAERLLAAENVRRERRSGSS